MTELKIYHLNCGLLHAPPGPKASCHCVLLEHRDRLVLIDTGIGLEDIRDPVGRIGQPAIEAAGFQFHENLAAARQIEALGLQPEALTDIVLTHGDHDHVGGLADFPNARVHISAEELAQIEIANPRYSPSQFSHQPIWVPHPPSEERWFGLEARPLSVIAGVTVYLVPLFGHTLGHCGVALQSGSQWMFHVGDAYYLRAELANDEHPVSQLAARAAADDSQRKSSLLELRRLNLNHGPEITMFGYHDFSEFPQPLTAAPPPDHSGRAGGC